MLDESLDEITAWAQSGPAEEFRFTLFFVPYVVKKEDQYLVAYKGQPPERRKMHLAVIPQTKGGTTPEEAFDYLKKSGICGLMSAARSQSFEAEFKAWWTGPKEQGEGQGT